MMPVQNMKKPAAEARPSGKQPEAAARKWRGDHKRRRRQSTVRMAPNHQHKYSRLRHDSHDPWGIKARAVALRAL